MEGEILAELRKLNSKMDRLLSMVLPIMTILRKWEKRQNIPSEAESEAYYKTQA